MIRIANQFQEQSTSVQLSCCCCLSYFPSNSEQCDIPQSPAFRDYSSQIFSNILCSICETKFFQKSSQLDVLRSLMSFYQNGYQRNDQFQDQTLKIKDLVILVMHALNQVRGLQNGQSNLEKQFQEIKETDCKTSNQIINKEIKEVEKVNKCSFNSNQSSKQTELNDEKISSLRYIQCVNLSSKDDQAEIIDRANTFGRNNNYQKQQQKQEEQVVPYFKPREVRTANNSRRQSLETEQIESELQLVQPRKTINNLVFKSAKANLEQNNLKTEFTNNSSNNNKRKLLVRRFSTETSAGQEKYSCIPSMQKQSNDQITLQNIQINSIQNKQNVITPTPKGDAPITKKKLVVKITKNGVHSQPSSKPSFQYYTENRLDIKRSSLSSIETTYGASTAAVNSNNSALSHYLLYEDSQNKALQLSSISNVNHQKEEDEDHFKNNTDQIELIKLQETESIPSPSDQQESFVNLNFQPQGISFTIKSEQENGLLTFKGSDNILEEEEQKESRQELKQPKQNENNRMNNKGKRIEHNLSLINGNSQRFNHLLNQNMYQDCVLEKQIVTKSFNQGEDVKSDEVRDLESSEEEKRVETMNESHFMPRDRYYHTNNARSRTLDSSTEKDNQTEFSNIPFSKNKILNSSVNCSFIRSIQTHSSLSPKSQKQSYSKQVSQKVNPTPNQEKQIIRSLIQGEYLEGGYMSQNRGVLNEMKYIISAEWWRQWKSYVGFNDNRNCWYGERPNQIKNQPLIDDEQMVEYHRNYNSAKLKNNLLEHYDYEAIPKRVFDHLKEWYGIDHEIVRYLKYDPSQSLNGQVCLDLYPEHFKAESLPMGIRTRKRGNVNNSEDIDGQQQKRSQSSQLEDYKTNHTQKQNKIANNNNNKKRGAQQKMSVHESIDLKDINCSLSASQTQQAGISSGSRVVNKSSMCSIF